MKKILAAALMLALPISMYGTQHQGSRPQHSNGREQHRPSQSNHERGHERGRERHPDHGRDGRHFDRDNHHHIDFHHTRVGRYGRVEFFWGGYWFGCEADMPYWVFREDVYLVMIGSGIYAVYEYGNPGMMLQVYIVE
jgi:hypothetical protein